MTQRTIRTIRGIRDSIPSGYVIGRASPGEGAAELIPIGTKLAQQIVTGGTVPSQQQVIEATSTADFAIFWPGATMNNVIFAQFKLTAAITLPAALTGSLFTAATAATANYAVTISKNGTSVGTLTFEPSGSVAVSFASAVSYAVGDLFSLAGPATADSTLANIGFAFAATFTQPAS